MVGSPKNASSQIFYAGCQCKCGFGTQFWHSIFILGRALIMKCLSEINFSSRGRAKDPSFNPQFQPRQFFGLYLRDSVEHALVENPLDMLAAKIPQSLGFSWNLFSRRRFNFAWIAIAHQSSVSGLFNIQCGLWEVPQYKQVSRRSLLDPLNILTSSSIQFVEKNGLLLMPHNVKLGITSPRVCKFLGYWTLAPFFTNAWHAYLSSNALHDFLICCRRQYPHLLTASVAELSTRTWNLRSLVLIQDPNTLFPRHILNVNFFRSETGSGHGNFRHPFRPLS